MKLKSQYSTSNTPDMIPASFKMATLFPCCAMRVNRPALPLSDVPRLEKTSFYFIAAMSA